MKEKLIQEKQMNTQLTNQEKPSLVSVIAWMTLVSGIVNLGFGIVAFTTFIGWICAPVSVLPIILGAFELVYSAKLLSNPIQPIRPSTSIAVFEIASVLYGNIFSIVVGILALVFYNDTVVKNYFAHLNGTLPPESVTPPAPTSLPEPEPAPVIASPMRIEEPEMTPAEEPIAPQPEETPDKPKRVPRKVAKK
jgi:hypothetical protein